MQNMSFFIIEKIKNTASAQLWTGVRVVVRMSVTFTISLLSNV